MNKRDDADFIVIGGGSAGSIVAARLASAGLSVILVEAGGTHRRPDVAVPLGIMSLYATANWKYPTTPDPSKDNQPGAFASGRIIGGSGSINAMVYARGRRSDYDNWAEAGATGWSYDDVLTWILGDEDAPRGLTARAGIRAPVPLRSRDFCLPPLLGFNQFS